MKRKMKYEVRMGFVNYLGEVYEVMTIAQFISRERAESYIKVCIAEDEKANLEEVKYEIIER